MLSGQGSHHWTARSGVELTTHVALPLLYRNMGNMMPFILFREPKRTGILWPLLHPSLFQSVFLQFTFPFILPRSGVYGIPLQKQVRYDVIQETKRMVSSYPYCTPACFRFRKFSFLFARHVSASSSDFSFNLFSSQT